MRVSRARGRRRRRGRGRTAVTAHAQAHGQRQRYSGSATVRLDFTERSHATYRRYAPVAAGCRTRFDYDVRRSCCVPRRPVRPQTTARHAARCARRYCRHACSCIQDLQDGGVSRTTQRRIRRGHSLLSSATANYTGACAQGHRGGSKRASPRRVHGQSLSAALVQNAQVPFGRAMET